MGEELYEKIEELVTKVAPGSNRGLRLSARLIKNNCTERTPVTMPITKATQNLTHQIEWSQSFNPRKLDTNGEQNRNAVKSPLRLNRKTEEMILWWTVEACNYEKLNNKINMNESNCEFKNKPTWLVPLYPRVRNNDSHSYECFEWTISHNYNNTNSMWNNQSIRSKMNSILVFCVLSLELFLCKKETVKNWADQLFSQAINYTVQSLFVIPFHVYKS